MLEPEQYGGPRTLIFSKMELNFVPVQTPLQQVGSTGLYSTDRDKIAKLSHGDLQRKTYLQLVQLSCFFSGLFHTLQSGRCLIEITTTLLQGDSKTLRPVHLICKSYHLFLFVVVVVAKPKSLGFALQMFLTERIEVNKNSVDIGKKT